MGDPQPPVSTHQSWTGSVAVYVAKPPRAALYAGQGCTTTAAAPAAPDAPTAASAPGSQPPQPHPAAPAAAAARQQQQQQPVLPSAPNKAALRGTWLLSKGSATLTAALSAEGRGEFTVKVQLQGTTLWVQDLFSGGGQVRLLAPTPPQEQAGLGSSKGGEGGGDAAPAAKIPSGATAASAGTQQPWLLLLLPCGSAQADAGTVSAAPLWPEPSPQPKQPQSESGNGGITAAAVPPPQPFSSSPPPALCFRFNSPGEGRAFQSLMTSAERVREAVVRRAEERRREAEQRRAERAERLRLRLQASEQQRRQQQRLQQDEQQNQQRQQNLRGLSLAQQAARTAAQGPDEAIPKVDHITRVPSRALGAWWSDADIQAAIERYLLEPGFQALVERVEAVWEQMEEQAERQEQDGTAAAAGAAAGHGGHGGHGSGGADAHECAAVGTQAGC